MKYALGIDPHNPTNSTSAIAPAVVESGGNRYLTLTFKQRKLTPNLQYIPEVTADKLTWNSGNSYLQVQVAPFDNQFDLVTVQDLTPTTVATPRGIRLRVVAP